MAARRCQPLRRCGLAAVAACALLLTGCAAPSAPSAPSGPSGPSGPSAASAPASPGANAPATPTTPAPRAVVLLFLATDCPIANAYQPEIERLRARFEPAGIAFVGVYPERGATAEELATHARSYRIRYPQALDPRMTLAAACGATVTPEAAVLVPAAPGPRISGVPQLGEGVLVYRGRIDDWYPARGARRAAPGTHDLQQVLESIAAGAVPAPATTAAVGCTFRSPP